MEDVAVDDFWRGADEAGGDLFEYLVVRSFEKVPRKRLRECTTQTLIFCLSHFDSFRVEYGLNETQQAWYRMLLAVLRGRLE